MKNIFESVELFYFDACPSWQSARVLLEDLLDEMGIDGEIQMKQIKTNEEAIRLEFPGSPTIRVDGKDLFPVSHKGYALGCRIYETPVGFRGLPTREMLCERLVYLVGNRNK